MSQIGNEMHLKLLRYLEANPRVSQRELAQDLGVSLGKVNYCLQALVDKGLVEARNYKNTANKRAYLYLLTTKGIREKAKIGVCFLQRKIEEQEMLLVEIEELRNEIKNGNTASGK